MAKPPGIPLKRYRKQFSHSYSRGVFATLEMLRHKREHVAQVLARTDADDNAGVRKIHEICTRNDIPFETSDKLVRRLAPKESHLVVGVFDKYETPLATRENHVVLVNPADMGNLGTIMRSMAGFDVVNLAIIRPAVDYFDPRVVRASMGAIFQMSVRYFESFEAYRELFQHQVYTFVTHEGQRIEEMRFQSPYALVFGNEGEGLSAKYLRAGTPVSIRHSERVNSLNISVAVGIALYEARKGRFLD